MTNTCLVGVIHHGFSDYHEDHSIQREYIGTLMSPYGRYLACSATVVANEVSDTVVGRFRTYLLSHVYDNTYFNLHRHDGETIGFCRTLTDEDDFGISDGSIFVDCKPNYEDAVTGELIPLGRINLRDGRNVTNIFKLYNRLSISSYLPTHIFDDLRSDNGNVVRCNLDIGTLVVQGRTIDSMFSGHNRIFFRASRFIDTQVFIRDGLVYNQIGCRYYNGNFTDLVSYNYRFIGNVLLSDDYEAPQITSSTTAMPMPTTTIVPESITTIAPESTTVAYSSSDYVKQIQTTTEIISTNMPSAETPDKENSNSISDSGLAKEFIPAIIVTFVFISVILIGLCIKYKNSMFKKIRKYIHNENAVKPPVEINIDNINNQGTTYTADGRLITLI